MVCEKCKKNPANVHVKHNINGMILEMHLCQDCSMQLDKPISFENIFHSIIDSLITMTAMNQKNNQSPVNANLKCAVCGMTHEGFKTSGKLGCASCYQTFASELETILKNVQGSTRHEGKYPRKNGVALFHKREVDRLRQELNKAIADENFEDAVRLRDLIKSMEVSS